MLISLIHIQPVFFKKIRLNKVNKAIKMEIYQDIFNALTLPCLVLEPVGGQFLIRDANKEWLNGVAKKGENLIGMSIPEVFPENPEHLGTTWEEIHTSLNKALVKGEPDHIETLRYDMLNFETDEFEEAYWQIENIPVKDETSGMVTFILFIARDKTSEVLAKLK
jgi:PAS domain-containing protein